MEKESQITFRKIAKLNVSTKVEYFTPIVPGCIMLSFNRNQQERHVIG